MKNLTEKQFEEMEQELLKEFEIDDSTNELVKVIQEIAIGVSITTLKKYQEKVNS